MATISKLIAWQRLLLGEVGLVAIAALLLIAAPAVAQTGGQPTAPNGCGTGWSRYLVPDSIPLLQCQFKNSCDKHDVCYGNCETSVEGVCEYRRCRTGGDLEGNDICLTDKHMIELRAMANVRRKQCDRLFHDDLRAANPGKMVCAAFAIVYREAVKAFGADRFIGADRVEGLKQSETDYEGAIREFFRSGTLQQFERLVEGVEAGRPIVKFNEGLYFSKSSGLSNDAR